MDESQPVRAPRAVAAVEARARHAAGFCYVLLAVGVAGYAGSTLLRSPGHYMPMLDDTLVDILDGLAGLICLARALLPGPQRKVALCMGSGIVLWSLGSLTFSLESTGGAAPPVPSAADAFYLMFYPLAYLAVMLLIRAGSRQFLPSMWLNGAVAGLGAAAVCATFVVDTVMTVTGGKALAVAVNLAYPIGDLILLALAAGALALLPGRWDPRWLTLAAGALLYALADTMYLFQDAAGTYHEGSLLDAGWPAALLLMSCAVWQRPPDRAVLRLDGAALLLMPGAAGIAGLGILVYGNFHHLGLVGLCLASATILAAAARLVMSLRDLRTLAHSRRQAVTDELTGLGNRRLLSAHLDRLLIDPTARAGANGNGKDTAETGPDRPQLALLLIDLNRFKEINDSFGHPVGDELLRQLGPRLRAVLRRTDTLVRLGGDEFAVVLADADTDYASEVAQRITADLQRPFPLEAVSLHISASIGIARYPQDALDANGLLRCADVAMYRAKGARYSFTVYDGSSDNSLSRLQLAEDLRAAIRDRDLVLYFQPQLDLASGAVPSVEALLRWPHPERGFIPPDTFIPVAEETGLMRGLTALVLELALAQCARWQAVGKQIAVAVNLSTTNLLDTELVHQVEALLAVHRLRPSALILEITESTLMADTTRAQQVVRQLRDLGVTVSIDDFGTGFSSLAYLRDLAVGELKLDRAFILGLGEAPGSGAGAGAGATARVRAGGGPDAAIVRSAIDLAHALELRVVAEGVETGAALARLAAMGCDLAQGYHISRPLPAADLDLSARAVTASGAAWSIAALDAEPLGDAGPA